MKIAINATVVKSQNSGSGFYVINLINSLMKYDSKNTYYIFINSDFFEKYIKIKKENFIVIDKRFRNRVFRVLWETLILPFEVRKRQAGILHCPNYFTPLFKMGFKIIVTFHDLTFYLFPDKYTIPKRLFYKLMVPYFVKISDIIISDSNNTATDFLKYFKNYSHKLKTVHLGCPENYNTDSNELFAMDILKKYEINKHYALFVGTIEPRKNILSIIKAFINVDSIVDMDLVIVGNKGWYYEDIYDYLRNINMSKLKNKIIFTGFISEDEIVHFYRNAMMFIYPSIYEGFGYPPLYAMSCGTPVITSNISSLPEVAGDAAILIDPYDINELEEAIKLLYFNPEYRKKLIEKGLMQSKKFNVEDFTQNTMKIYEEFTDSTI